MELFMVSLIGPTLTAGAIASEREHQTFEILRATALSARSLVLGKLGASLAYLLLLIVAALPIESIAFLLGGVALEEVLVSSLMLVVTALFYCSLGLFFSSFMKRTTSANVASYVTIVLSYILLGVVFYILTMIEINSYASYGTYRNDTAWETFLSILMWTLISVNPLLAATMSEVILVEDQSLWTTSQSLFGGQSLTFVSPWILYTLIYIGLSLLMIFLSIRFVNRPDK
jgi:ABC-type transport system involved in multi-copper enzyme maturation permease subunit